MSSPNENSLDAFILEARSIKDEIEANNNKRKQDEESESTNPNKKSKSDDEQDPPESLDQADDVGADFDCEIIEKPVPLVVVEDDDMNSSVTPNDNNINATSSSVVDPTTSSSVAALINPGGYSTNPVFPVNQQNNSIESATSFVPVESDLPSPVNQQLPGISSDSAYQATSSVNQQPDSSSHEIINPTIPVVVPSIKQEPSTVVKQEASSTSTSRESCKYGVRCYR